MQDQWNGLLVVDKPGRQRTGLERSTAQPEPGARRVRDEQRLYTSHDVVQLVRRWSRQRRIGHTGTLDPLASGVMVLCLGAATRLTEYYQGETKRYYAEIILGCATDSYDSLGQVTATSTPPKLGVGEAERVLEQFRGEVRQRPPAFSAIKQGGEALYARARRGEAVEAAERLVTFYRLELVEVSPERISVRAECSAGAYMRSLAHDLGLALGTHGTLDVLRREAVGEFTLAQAASLAAVEQAAQAGELGRLLLPTGTGLPLPAVTLSDALLRRLQQGQRVPLPVTVCDPQQPLQRACDAAGVMLGTIKCVQPVAATGEPEQEPAAVWKAEKWLR